MCLLLQAQKAAAAGAGAVCARPALKRPTVQRPAPPPRAAPAEDAPGARRPPEAGEAPAAAKRARTELGEAVKPAAPPQQCAQPCVPGSGLK